MSDSKISQLRQMGRRRFLNTLGKMGISATTLSYITKDSLAELTGDLEETVPYVAYLEHTNHEAVVQGTEAPKRKPIYETIPYDKWVQIEARNHAAQKIQKQIQSFTSSDLVSTGIRSIVSGHKRRNIIEVDYTTLRTTTGKTFEPDVNFSTVQERIPDKIDGKAGEGGDSRTITDIPIRINKVEHIQQSDCYFDEYRPVPAGCWIETSSEKGTTGAVATDKETGNDVLLTAAHVVSSSETEVHQPYEFDETIGAAGRVKKDGDKFDAATIEPTELVTRDFARSGGNSYMGWPIKGIVAWDKIKNNVGNTDYKLYLQGHKTCRNKGYITEKTNAPFDLSCDLTFQINVDSESGDSGGPHFDVRTDSDGNEVAYIAGIHGWQGDTDSEAKATAMKAVENCLNVEV